MTNNKEIIFSAVNLGCAKNLVDTEYILGELLTSTKGADFIFSYTPEDPDVGYVIINTCGFISSSRDEAEKTIKYYDDLGKKIVIVGCYVEVKNDEFLSSLKNLIAAVPFDKTLNIKKIISYYKGKQDMSLTEYLNKDKKAHVFTSKNTRAFFNTDLGYAYLKIAEGCDNNCTFCIIPQIRGKQTSRTIEDILKELQIMINFGIKEVEIIAEDTTQYGKDLYGEPKLIELLEQIENTNGDFKYRLFYMYPDILNLNNLEKLSKFKKFIPYFDFPFQHISPSILKRMGRFYDEEHVYKLIKYIKQNFKDAFIHTNFIIGFPGETDEDFQKLLDFTREIEFDSVSVFGYHDECRATSSKLDNKVPDNIIKKRVEEFEKLQNKIYEKKQKARIGKKHIGYIEDILEDSVLIRPEIKAPEIDELDSVKLKDITKGEIKFGEKVEYTLINYY